MGPTRIGPRLPTLRHAVTVPGADAGGGAAAVGVGVGVGGTGVATAVGAGVCGAAVGVAGVPPSVPAVDDPHAASTSKLKVPPNITRFRCIDWCSAVIAAYLSDS